MDPQYANYPRANPTNRPVRPPGVHFDTIGDAFNIVRNDPGTWILASLVSLIAYLAVLFTLSLVSNRLIYGSFMGPNLFDGAVPDVGWTSIPISLGSILIGCTFLEMLYTGMSLMGRRAAYGEAISVGEVFLGFRHIVRLLPVTLLCWSLRIFGFFLLIVPSIVAWGLFGLAPIACVDQRLGIGGSFGWCTRNASPHLWGIFGLLFLASFVAGIGAFVCLVGILFTLPIFPIVAGLTYDSFVPYRQQDFSSGGMTYAPGAYPGTYSGYGEYGGTGAGTPAPPTPPPIVPEPPRSNGDGQSPDL